MLRDIPKRLWLYLFVILIALSGLANYALREKSIFSYSSGKPVVLGLSLVTQNPTAILDDLHNSFNDSNAQSDIITSFLLQARNPVTEIFLDYIVVPDNNNIPGDRICFQKIITTNSNGDSTQWLSKNSILTNLSTEGDSYIYSFLADRCAQKGKKYVIPHVFLGIELAETQSMFGLNGYQTSQFYPFDTQQIQLNITVESDEFKPFFPSLDVVVAEKGWKGIIKDSSAKVPTLILQRPLGYKITTLVFFVLMILIILLLSIAVRESGNFLQIAFGLLLGVWGIRQMLVPTYINSSILIDFAIYTLFVLVIMEILGALYFEHQRRKIQILNIYSQTDDSEYVTIGNASHFPIDLTGWLLLDKEGNKYKFPKFVLSGRNPFSKLVPSVKIWTMDGVDSNINLYWGNPVRIWERSQDTAYLEDANGDLISAYNKSRLV